ncbi:Thioredoxin domain-containing protein 17 [Phlyctochytrium bullatum]|nr:Thioredoxin domain-containing protein 17 [Phlyctochytrium bullatum]
MPLVKQRIEAFDSFDATLNQAVQDHPGRIFVYLFANEDPATGQSWCPDCRNAEPLIKKHLETVDGGLVLEVAAGDRPTWKDPNNFYRHHAELKATSVPTLYEIGKDGKVLKKLVENEAEDEAALADFTK